MKNKKMIFNGQMLVELIMAIGIAAIIIPALLTGLVASREGRPQQQQRAQAISLLKETTAAVRNVKDTDWNDFAMNGTFHPEISNNKWTLSSNAQTVNGLTQQVVISDVYRDSAGAIVTSGGTLDPSTKQAVVTVSWTQPQSSSMSSTIYLTRTQNLSYANTTQAQFDTGQYTNLSSFTGTGNDGSIRLANNNKAKWCSPSLSEANIDLPDGPPVAVAATASAVSNTIPNDVFVATAPNTSSSIKLAYVNVAADVATPAGALRGTFTLDASKYSSGTFPNGINLATNSFKTNDVKYYKSSAGKLYALLATDLSDHEVIAVQLNDGTSDAFQDPVNKIYKYWTFFDTKRYSSASGNDQSPYGYGGVSLAVFEDRGYVASGGYLYTFNLSNIDSKSPTSSTGLDQVGCRIELDGYDCNASTSNKAKYTGTNTNTSWSENSANAACTDGGNTELYADNDIYPVRATTGSPTGVFIFVAVGNGIDPELDIVNVTSPPGSGLSNSSCGRTTSGWQISGRTSGGSQGSMDFNQRSGTQEAANSVFAKSDGTRAYISSNGGVDANSDGQPDSKQLYIINTTNKSSPAFLSGSSGSPNYGPLSGYYDGASPAPVGDSELYPRRSLTVLNGQRAVLVGKDGVSNGNNAEEYQVLDTETEATPTYCKGVDFPDGFNDLTSVSEADNENYVYMVANNQSFELKIVEGGPDNAIYVPSGTYVSPIFDAASVYGNQSLHAFNRFLANIYQPAIATTVGVQVAVASAVNNSCSGASYIYLGPNSTSDSTDVYTTNSIGTTTIAYPIPLLSIGNYQNPGRCFRYKIYLTTDDQMQTPILNDMNWNYSQ